MKDLAWLQKWTELVASADTIAEYGRKLVHSALTAPSAVGAHIYQLDSRGQIELLGGYGLNPLGNNLRVSAWDDHALSKSIRSRELTQEVQDLEGIDYRLKVIAIMKGDEPLGAMVISQREEELDELPKDLAAAMSQVLGLWLNSMGFGQDWKPNGNLNSESDPDSLTDRQLRVLDLISRGMTNAEIAQDLILSESSIRQETVKIYKALGVSSRLEASKRAVHLGILRPAAI